LTTGTGTTAVTVTGMLTLTVTGATLVSIAVSAELPVASATPQIAKNTKVQLDAIGTYTDSSTQDLTTTVVWSSSAANVTVSGAAGSEGLASANGNAGAATITAKLTTGTGAAAVTVMGTLTLTVTNALLVSIVVTPATPAIAAGTSLQFVATGFFSDASKQFVTESAAWLSATPATATVSSVTGTKGLAKALVLGSSVITASVGAINDTATLTVSAAVLQTIAISPDAPGVALGSTITLAAEGSYSDGSKQDLTATVHWDSATTTVATISNAANPGKVTPVAKGMSVITASFTPPGGVKVTGTATLTVSDAVLDSIAVTAAAATTIEKGATLQLTATGTFTAGPTVDLTKMVTWGSDTTGVATVSNVAASAGLVTATGTGTAVITATSTAPSSTGHAVVGMLTITVNDGVLKSIVVTPATPSIAVGTKLQFVATGTYDDAATLDITSSVTWASDTATIATFDNLAGDEGVAAGVAAGSAKITASQGTISGSTMLTVTAAKLVSIVLKPQPTASIAKGTSVQFTATGFFDDTTTQDLTDTANWASSVMTTATISNDPASNGLAFGKAQAAAATNITATVVIGTLTITSSPTALTVTAATLVSLAITPATAKLPKGSTLTFVATGTFTDASTQDLTDTVTWAPATGATATVSNAHNQHGRATGVAAGTVDVTATSGTVVAHAALTVTAAIASIAVTPAAPTIAKTLTQQFSALATLTDATTLDVSSFATWTSVTPADATISATGLATGVAAGTSKITAASGGITSPQVTLTVTN
jgi:Big-like domain-containing protein